MQVNKQIIIILILASLLFSALGTAFYFYKKNKEVLKSKNELVTIYVAIKDVKKNTLLDKSHLGQTEIAKQYILNEPLLKKEILGKYVNENIYKNEVFLKQKLNTKIEKAKAKILDFTNSSYNMKFDLFQNPNISLLQGDFINIISVFPKKGEKVKQGEYSEYDVQYVASNVKVLGFLRDGRPESETITKHNIEVIEKKKVVKKIIDVKADELMLDINPYILLNLVKNYSIGNQLWMVKTKESIIITPKVEKKIIKIAEPKVKFLIKEDLDKKVLAKKVYKPVQYKYAWYKPSKSIVQKSAVIDYSGDKNNEKSKTKNVSIVINKSNDCLKIKDKLIVGIKNSFYMRDESNTKSKFKVLSKKNTIIPYLLELPLWYKTCDGLFVSKSVVKKISYSSALSKVGKYD